MTYFCINPFLKKPLYIRISVFTLPTSRLLINPDIKATYAFKDGTYKLYHRIVSIVRASLQLNSHIIFSLRILGTLALKVWWVTLI